MRYRSLIAVVPAFALALAACSDTPTELDRAQFHHNDDHVGGLVCPNDDPLGLDPEQWTKIDSGSGNASGDWGSFSYLNKTITYSVNDGYTLQLCIKSGSQVGRIFVNREGPDAGTITIDQDISHISWRISGDVPDEGQWCSPGFWRNNPLAAAVADPDYATRLYSAVFGAAPPRSPLGIRQNRTADPTLKQVLDGPQFYGGGAFNNVGDYLSDLHPDVDFRDDRVEGSCPLSSDRSANRIS